jgi:hypothetical protein
MSEALCLNQDQIGLFIAVVAIHWAYQFNRA